MKLPKHSRIQFPENRLKSKFFKKNTIRRERSSKTYRLKCSKRSPKLKENLLLPLKSIRTMKVLKKNTLTDWKKKSKYLRNPMICLLNNNQLVKQVKEKKLKNGRSNATRLKDKKMKFQLNLRKKKLSGQVNMNSKKSNRNNSNLILRIITKCSKIIFLITRRIVMTKRVRLLTNIILK